MDRSCKRYENSFRQPIRILRNHVRVVLTSGKTNNVISASYSNIHDPFLGRKVGYDVAYATTKIHGFGVQFRSEITSNSKKYE